MMHHQRTNVVGCQSHCFAWYHFETLVTSHTHKNDSSCLIQDYMPSSLHNNTITESLDIFRAWKDHSLDKCKWLPVHAGGHLGLDQAGQHSNFTLTSYIAKAIICPKLLCSPLSDYCLLYRQGNNRNLHIWVYLLKLTPSVCPQWLATTHWYNTCLWPALHDVVYIVATCIYNYLYMCRTHIYIQYTM